MPTEEVSASTQETRDSTHEITTHASTMADTAETLRRVVGRFQLQIADSGSLDEVLRAALEAHESWNAKLREAIETGRSPMKVEQAGRDDACTFGKWLHTAGRFRSDKPQIWQELHDLHEQFHRDASGVLQLAISGQQANARESLGAEHFVTVQRKLRAVLERAAA